MIYVNHLTLTTGHLRRSARAEVDDATLALLAPWLAQSINSGRCHALPVAALAHLSARVSLAGGALLLTVFGPSGPHLEGRPHAGPGDPLITMGIAQRSRQGAELWAMMVAQFGAAPRADKPAEPWCAVALHPALAAHRESAHWLGDFERCVAWAWATRNPTLTEALGAQSQSR